MSRIGHKPITLPQGVTATIDGQHVEVKGPKGTLTFNVNQDMDLALEDNELTVSRPSDSKQHRMLHGTSRAVLLNMVKGVSEGFTRSLEINGTGYRAQVQGAVLTLQLGYSHDIHYEIPEGVSITCPKATQVQVHGASKQQVGQVAAIIRGFRPPEPYKGKGVKYSDETLIRKEGKKK